MPDDRRLIEDYLRIRCSSAEASREKSIWKADLSTLDMWWVRQRFVAWAAAVCGSLVPASRFVLGRVSTQTQPALSPPRAFDVDCFPRGRSHDIG